MNIAVACDGLVIAPYFVQCNGYMVYSVDRGVVVDSRNLPVFDRSVHRAVNLFQSIGIDVLIVGRIDSEMASVIRSSGIELVEGAQDDPLVATREFISNLFLAAECS